MTTTTTTTTTSSQQSLVHVTEESKVGTYKKTVVVEEGASGLRCERSINKSTPDGESCERAQARCRAGNIQGNAPRLVVPAMIQVCTVRNGHIVSHVGGGGFTRDATRGEFDQHARRATSTQGSYVDRNKYQEWNR